MVDAGWDYIEGTIEVYRMRRDERSETGIRRLTVLAGIIGPLSLLAGIYGTNFQNIPGTGAPWGFWGFHRRAGRLPGLAALWYLRRRGLL